MEISITRQDDIRISKNIPNNASLDIVFQSLYRMLVVAGYSEESIAEYIKFELPF